MSHPKISTKFPNFMTITRKNYSGSLCFHERSKKKMLELLKYTQISPSPSFNLLPSLEKVCQAVVARNDQENLQPILNGATLTIRVSDCSLDLLQNDSSQSRDGSKESAILKKRYPFDSI